MVKALLSQKGKKQALREKCFFYLHIIFGNPFLLLT